jgi:lipoprotein-anchoring transpeptidase ErfK/SrfK
MIRFFVMLFALILGITLLALDAKADVFITIDKSTQQMYVETPTDSYVWDVSTARKGYHTPTGDFQPYLLKSMHYSSKYDNAPMPNSIFFHGGYAIHATYDVKRLGRPASHGCIRLSPQNAKWLYRIVSEYGKENTFIRIVN